MTYRIPKPKTIAAKFRRDVKILKELLPPLLTVRVYRRKVEWALGYTEVLYNTEGRPDRFIVVVSNDLSWDATWQVLIHEWAHALAWREGHETVEDHGPEWALALSRIYQDTVEP